MIVLRDGSAVDAASLVAVQKTASVAAFADIFPPESYPYPEDAVLADLRGRLGVGSELVVAEEAGRPVGFACRAAGWLEQLFVLPQRWGGERRGWRLDGRTRRVTYPPHPLDVGYTLELSRAVSVEKVPA